MRKIYSKVKISLLSKLSVSTARKYLQPSKLTNNDPISTSGEKQLLVDISVILQSDGRTGIQRVVRALLLHLHSLCPAGYRVRPVFATRKQDYHYAPDLFGLHDVQFSSTEKSLTVTVEPGDIFLGLDLAANVLPRHKAQLAEWKKHGTKIHFVVYDLLPVLHPYWFKSNTTRHFHSWLRTIAMFADGIICISNTVKNELEAWLIEKYSLPNNSIPISTISLGADIESSKPSHGLPGNVTQLLSEFSSKPTFLMVGTLEPRKGHEQILTAFEQLWQQGYDINFVIVGKPGWKTESLQNRLNSHLQYNKLLYWLNNSSDEMLALLYNICNGVIVASEAEGFGLPLIEALRYNKKVLARDIPVIREIGGKGVTLFSGVNTEILLNEIKSWLKKISNEDVLQSAPQHYWHDSALELLDRLGISNFEFAQLQRNQNFDSIVNNKPVQNNHHAHKPT